MTNNQKLNKLCNIRTDLCDDSSHVTTINTKIQAVSDDFGGLIKSSYTSGIKGKIEDLKEPSQSSDSLLKNARSYNQYEINAVCKAIEDESKK